MTPGGKAAWAHSSGRRVLRAPAQFSPAARGGPDDTELFPQCFRAWRPTGRRIPPAMSSRYSWLATPVHRHRPESVRIGASVASSPPAIFIHGPCMNLDLSADRHVATAAAEAGTLDSVTVCRNPRLVGRSMKPLPSERSSGDNGVHTDSSGARRAGWRRRPSAINTTDPRHANRQTLSSICYHTYTRQWSF